MHKYVYEGIECILTLYRHMYVRTYVLKFIAHAVGRCTMIHNLNTPVSNLIEGAKETSSSKNGDSGMDGGSHDGDAEEDPQFDLSNPGGVVTENNSTIILENVPIITPNLDIVVPKLSLKVKICVYVSHVFVFI